MQVELDNDGERKQVTVNEAGTGTRSSSSSL